MGCHYPHEIIKDDYKNYNNIKVYNTFSNYITKSI